MKKKKKQYYYPVMRMSAPVPDAVLELILCLCKGGCNNRRCQCVKNDMFYA